MFESKNVLINRIAFTFDKIIIVLEQSDESASQKKYLSHNEVQKQNIFQMDSGQQQTKKPQNIQISNEKPKSQKMIERLNQIYDAAKIQQNEHYIGSKRNQQEDFQKQRENDKVKGKKKNLKNKKMNLFQSDSNQSQDEQQKKLTHPVALKSQNRKESTNDADKIQLVKNIQSKTEEGYEQPNYKNKEDNAEEQEEDIQQDNSYEAKEQQEQQERAQKMKKMLERQQSKQKNIDKQESFSRLIEKAGADKEKLKQLVYQPIPVGYKAICIFKRVSNGFSQNYQLVLQDDERSLFFCENQRGSIGANYYLSLTKQMDKKSQSYLGKLRGNSTGSIYQLYDCGKQPQKNLNRKDWRISMARIEYETNFMGINGPRKLKVVVPKVCNIEQLDTFKLAQNQDLSQFEPPIVIKYRNKQPRWNQRLKSYALNFGGRVKQASIKNFILVDDSASPQKQFQAPNALVFGKIDDNSFSLEAIYPLSLFQAFGIVLSEFDFKLNCQ